MMIHRIGCRCRPSFFYYSIKFSLFWKGPFDSFKPRLLSSFRTRATAFGVPSWYEMIGAYCFLAVFIGTAGPCGRRTNINTRTKPPLCFLWFSAMLNKMERGRGGGGGVWWPVETGERQAWLMGQVMRTWEAGGGVCFWLEGKNKMQKYVKVRIFRRGIKAFRELLSDREMDSLRGREGKVMKIRKSDSFSCLPPMRAKEMVRGSDAE